MGILNLTQHPATREQKQAGVQDLEGEELEWLKWLLTFESLPTMREVWARAYNLADLAERKGARKVMIGGAPYLIYPLIITLRARGIQPLFAFSKREVEEEPQEDGSVRKIVVFRHLGFVVSKHGS